MPKKASATKASKGKVTSTGRRAPKRALCVGINDYPYDGNDLNGCVNDAHAWAEMLTTNFGFSGGDVRVITDAEATKKNVVAAVKTLLTGAQPGDVLVWHNSSHGSYVADTSGDEETYDECLCPYDIADNHILDDEIRELVTSIKPGVRLSVVFDNCHSGSGTRAIIGEGMGMQPPDRRRRRFLSPALRGLPILQNPWKAKPRGREKYPESKMKEILLSGCTDKEYSYDAFINGVYHGAMTYYALRTIEMAKYKLTYTQLHEGINSLIADYPQHPQLEGTKENKKRQIFA
ncbi:MAG TPA: caspase family protein [Pyrinomonadaceae bacterium]|jgi:hypothetical protein